VPCANWDVFVSPVDIAGFGRGSWAYGSNELGRDSGQAMRLQSAGIERGLVQRDRLHEALERKQRGPGADILRSQRLIVGAGADQAVQEAAWMAELGRTAQAN
jgi:hypothetical protein